MTSTDSQTAAAMLEQVRRHFVPPLQVRQGQVDSASILPGAVVLTEVPSPRSGRRIDALAIGLTQARAGLDGIEIKVDRGDWLRELDQPRKADAWLPHVHRWWIAAPSTTIVPEHELPEGWGLMVPSPRNGRRMRIVVKPQTREPEVTWGVMCEIVKKLDRYRATEVQTAADTISTQLRATYQDQLQQAANRLQTQADADRHAEIGRLLAQISGLDAWRLRTTLDTAGAPERRMLANLLGLVADARHGERLDWLLQTLARAGEEHAARADRYRGLADQLGQLADAPRVPDVGRSAG
ncbi:hypothetical protein [Amycolatopsis sp. NPDC058986]|uniref:hypothetical protein n=1 Tax=unclassified Amycolatopsis TaxID=2618356 RepID=UPI003671C3F4